MIGKVFSRGGGRYPGYWIVIGMTPGGSAILLGVNESGDLVGAATYQPHYVERKKAVAQVDVSELRFEDTSPSEGVGHRSEKTLDLPSLLKAEPPLYGGSNRNR